MKKAMILLSAFLVLITFISCDIVYSSTVSGTVKINKSDEIKIDKVTVYAYMGKSDRDTDFNKDKPTLFDDWTSATNSGQSWGQGGAGGNDESTYTFSLNNFMWKESGSEFGEVGARGECYLLVLVEYKNSENNSLIKKVKEVAPLVSDASRAVTITVDLN